MSNVDADLIAMLAAASDAQKVAGLASLGLSEFITVATWVLNNRDPHEQSIDTACKIEFCVRNNITTMSGIYSRFAPSFAGGTNIQRCGNPQCRWIGHKINNCPNK